MNLHKNVTLPKLLHVYNTTCSSLVNGHVYSLVNEFSPIQGDVWEVYHDIASYLLKTTSENVVGRGTPRMNTPHVHRTTSQLIQSTQPKVSPTPRGLRAMSAGAVSRRLRSRAALKGTPHTHGLKEPGTHTHTHTHTRMYVIWMVSHDMWCMKLPHYVHVHASTELGDMVLISAEVKKK